MSLTLGISFLSSLVVVVVVVVVGGGGGGGDGGGGGGDGGAGGVVVVVVAVVVIFLRGVGGGGVPSNNIGSVELCTARNGLSPFPFPKTDTPHPPDLYSLYHHSPCHIRRSPIHKALYFHDVTLHISPFTIQVQLCTRGDLHMKGVASQFFFCFF